MKMGKLSCKTVTRGPRTNSQTGCPERKGQYPTTEKPVHRLGMGSGESVHVGASVLKRKLCLDIWHSGIGFAHVRTVHARPASARQTSRSDQA